MTRHKCVNGINLSELEPLHQTDTSPVLLVCHTHKPELTSRLRSLLTRPRCLLCTWLWRGRRRCGRLFDGPKCLCPLSPGYTVAWQCCYCAWQISLTLRSDNNQMCLEILTPQWFVSVLPSVCIYWEVLWTSCYCRFMHKISLFVWRWHISLNLTNEWLFSEALQMVK